MKDDLSALTDCELLALIAEGSADGRSALAVLFGRYRRSLLGVARSRGMQQEEAEDLVQDVFIKLVRVAGQFEGGDSAAAWLITITRNEVINRFRAGAKEANLDEEGWDFIHNTVGDPAHGPDVLLALKQYQDCMDQAYAQFAAQHPDFADILYRAMHLRMSMADLAKVFETTAGAMKERVSQYRKKLLRFLEPCAALYVPEAP